VAAAPERAVAFGPESPCCVSVSVALIVLFRRINWL
jgi:hypothetical protein